MKYHRIIQAFQSTPWAILPTKLQEIIAFLELKSAGGTVSEAEIREFFDDSDERDSRSEPPPPQSIAVIPIHGVLARRMNLMIRASGGTSLQAASKALREATASSSVKASILDIDSPGGEVMGITEFHAEIVKARRTKPVFAFVSGMAASAAYHLASAAQEITATPSAMLGSIGVFGVHIDESKAMKDAGLGVTLKTAGKFKADATGLVPLSEEGGEELQRRVDESMSIMIRDIAKGRGLSVSVVRKSFGDARLVESKLALELGMIDKIETFDSVLARAGSGKPANASGASGARAENAAVVLHSVNPEPVELGEVAVGEVVPQGEGQQLAGEVAESLTEEQEREAREAHEHAIAFRERTRVDADAHARYLRQRT